MIPVVFERHEAELSAHSHNSRKTRFLNFASGGFNTNGEGPELNGFLTY
jgi:hypothetical protein